MKTTGRQDERRAGPPNPREFRSDGTAGILLVAVGSTLVLWDVIAPMRLVSAMPSPSFFHLLSALTSVICGLGLFLSRRGTAAGWRRAAALSVIILASAGLARWLAVDLLRAAPFVIFPLALGSTLLLRGNRLVAVFATIAVSFSVVGLVSIGTSLANGMSLRGQTGDVIRGSYVDEAAGFVINIPSRRWRPVIDPFDVYEVDGLDRLFVDPVRSASFDLHFAIMETRRSAKELAEFDAVTQAGSLQHGAAHAARTFEGGAYETAEVLITGRDESGWLATLQIVIKPEGHPVYLRCAGPQRWIRSLSEECRAIARSFRRLD